MSASSPRPCVDEWLREAGRDNPLDEAFRGLRIRDTPSTIAHSVLVLLIVGIIATLILTAESSPGFIVGIPVTVWVATRVARAARRGRIGRGFLPNAPSGLMGIEGLAPEAMVDLWTAGIRGSHIALSIYFRPHAVTPLAEDFLRKGAWIVGTGAAFLPMVAFPEYPVGALAAAAGGVIFAHAWARYERVAEPLSRLRHVLRNVIGMWDAESNSPVRLKLPFWVVAVPPLVVAVTVTMPIVLIGLTATLLMVFATFADPGAVILTESLTAQAALIAPFVVAALVLRRITARSEALFCEYSVLMLQHADRAFDLFIRSAVLQDPDAMRGDAP